MSATFASFNTALSALRYHQVVMDMASGNIANVSTDGYARRRAVGRDRGRPRRSRRCGAGTTGPATASASAGLDRMVDPFLDVRARREHGNQSYLDTRQATLERVEAGTRRARRERRRRRAGGLPQGVARPRQQPGLRRRPQPGARRARNTLADAIADPVAQRRDRGGRPAHAGCSTDRQRGQHPRRRPRRDQPQHRRRPAQRHRRRHPARQARPAGPAAVRAHRRRRHANGRRRPRRVRRRRAPGRPASDAGTLDDRERRHADGAADGARSPYAITAPDGATAVAVAGCAARSAATRRACSTPRSRRYRAGPRRGRPGRWRTSVNAQHARRLRRGRHRRRRASSAYDPADPGRLAERRHHRRGRRRRVRRGRWRPGRRATPPPWPSGIADAEGDYQRLVNGFGSEVASVRRLAANQQTLTAPGRRLPRAALRVSTSTRRW